MQGQAADRFADVVWGKALDRILKDQEATPTRPTLGDEISLLVPQGETAALLTHIPAFAKLLYTSAQTTTARNTYLVLRRLGMPTDFFWKFGTWTNKHAYETLDRIVTRVFSTLMSTHKEGQLKLASIDVSQMLFELTFESCAECAGLRCDSGICYFHAGAFAGMLEAMLDHPLDAVETECRASGADACRFTVALREDPSFAETVEQWLVSAAPESTGVTRWANSITAALDREMGGMVNVTYYQMLLASTFLPNLDVIERACYEAGVEIGRSLALTVDQPSEEAVERIYHDLKYTDLDIAKLDDGYRVKLREAPEAMGPLEGATLVPFLSGELVGLLSQIGGARLSVTETTVEEGSLVFRLTPQAQRV